MSDDRRKLNKHCTGTVPKVKHTVEYRNNTGQQLYSERDNLRNLPNNLSSEWPTRRPESNFHRNSQHMNFESMDTSLEESHQNGVYTNGTTTSSLTSSSNSRRNSCGTVPKCDNVAKYPNKKQIEDKLNQIREYLHITTSLMSSMKNADDQFDKYTGIFSSFLIKSDGENEIDNLSSIIDALKDSEAKLNSLLATDEDNKNSECIIDNSAEIKNEFEDQTNREILREVQNMSLQHLKQKGDSKLRDARRLQERLSQGHISNSNRMENNLQEYDLAIAELEETTKRLNGEAKGDVNNFHQQEEESFNSDEIEELQNQIQVMHTANEDRNKLIQLLDKRDAELRCQHLELQNKLTELQTKKSQVDHLVAALQNTPRSEDDMGSHVRKIVSMKDQLAKLKDMLEMVENTEVIMQNGTQEEQAIACEIYTKAENFLNKDLDKGNCSNQSHLDNHLPLQYENRAGPASVNLDNRGKQTNKTSREVGRGQCNETNAKLSEKLALQAELKAKKRELEEIMGKHKASTSNLNHDVGTDNKSEFSCSNSIFDNASGVWAPLLPSQHNQPDSSERYSSDDGTEDANDYRDVAPNRHQIQTAPAPPTSGHAIGGKYASERNNSSDFMTAQAYERLCQQSFFRLPESNARGGAAETNASFSRGSSVSNLGQVGKQNVQKQLELIRSVCDSMLPQQSGSNNQPNVHHLRNNLTPSPIYSELRPFSSPNQSHPSNALNVVSHATPNEGVAWYGAQPNLPFGDVANYQNWLATNTLQTQAFMLNSLNQCCQMLWLQQRELATLRGMVTALQQERLPSPHYNNENQITSPLNQNLNCNPIEPIQPPILNPCASVLNQCRPLNPKVNPVTAACSLSNLNQYNTEPVSVEFANHSNLRLVDAPVNNMNNHDERNVNMATLQGLVNNSDVRNVSMSTLQGVVNNSEVRNVNMASLQGGINNSELRNVNMASLQGVLNNSDGRNVNMATLQGVVNNSDMRNVNMASLQGVVNNNSDVRNVNMSALQMNNHDERNINMATLPVSNDNMNQLQGHIWNGQALNNQVAPGNRANNYWDNFRSYSRQNLFSTKSNDGIHNSPLIDRTNNVTPRSIPFEVHSTPKSNSQQVLATPQENAPQRSCVKPSRRYTNTNIAVVPPDVLNIKNDGLPLHPVQNEVRTTNESDIASPNHSVYSNSTPRTPRRHSNVVAPSVENLQNPRRRNASNESANTEGNAKSKLFEELRENVYREVASLISANEARPHFLIQLFRDLQLVSSDPLRLKTLQSIQVLISQSLRNSQSSEPSPNQELPSSSNEFSMQSTVWSPIPPNSVPRNATILEGLISKKGDSCQSQNTFHEIIPFLNDNEHLTINQHLLSTLKQKIVEAKSFKKAVKDTIFQKHFLNVLDDVLSFYNDKPMCAVKISLLQSVRDLLDRELSFMNLIQSAGESQLTDLVSSNLPASSNLLELRCQYPLKSEQVETGAVVQIQNEDLAEADQSHVEDDDVEEEGAVGGFLEGALEQNVGVADGSIKEDGDLSSAAEAFATSTEAESQYQLGLDQVPTRLPTKSKSPLNTPRRDRAQKRDDDQDHLN